MNTSQSALRRWWRQIERSTTLLPCPERCHRRGFGLVMLCRSTRWGWQRILPCSTNPVLSFRSLFKKMRPAVRGKAHGMPDQQAASRAVSEPMGILSARDLTCGAQRFTLNSQIVRTRAWSANKYKYVFPVDPCQSPRRKHVCAFYIGKAYTISVKLLFSIATFLTLPSSHPPRYPRHQGSWILWHRPRSASPKSLFVASE